MRLLVLLFTLATAAQAAKVYTSPDHALRAVVSTSSSGESRVVFESLRRRPVLIRDPHGYGIAHAAWTQDSQFFVAGTQASGGHQPWAYPIWIYSRAANQVFELGKVGLTAVSDFSVRPPDVLQTRVLDCARPISIRLRQLIVDGRSGNIRGLCKGAR